MRELVEAEIERMRDHMARPKAKPSTSDPV